MAINEDGSINADNGITVQEVLVVEPTLTEPLVAYPVHVFTHDPSADAVGVNTSTTPQTRIQGQCPPLTAGTYRVTVSYGWSSDSQTVDFAASCLFGGQSLSDHPSGLIHRQEVKDSAGQDSGAGTATDQQARFHAVYIETVVEGDEPEVLLQWRTTGSNVEAGIWDDVIIVERIGD